MRIILEKPGPRVDPPLKIKVEYGEGLEPHTLQTLKVDIEQKMSEILRFRPDIEVLPPESLERDPRKKGKLIEKLYEKS